MKTTWMCAALAAAIGTSVPGCAEDGDQGPTGSDGTDGTDGSDGSDGSDGTDGSDGQSGASFIVLSRIGGYESLDGTGARKFDEGAAEIVAFDPATDRLFVVNALDAVVEVLDASDPASPVKETEIDVTALGAVANSIDVSDGVLAVAIEADPKTDPGVVAFYDTTTLAAIHDVAVGALPDMVTFTPDGGRVLVANEGEPSDDYLTDPPGSVSVIDLSGGIASATVATAGFTGYDGDEAALRAQGIRIFGPGASASEDLEPEYIAVSADGATAWVTLQEANALAIVDVATATVTELVPLGYKDHSIPGNELDASNRDSALVPDDPAIAIRTWPVLGMYMPDAIAAYEFQGDTYLVTANEGDSRDYDGFSEETRVGDLTLDAAVFPDAASLQADTRLGRLTTTTASGDLDGDGDHDVLFAFGARSFSIRDAAGRLVFDSGNDFEVRTALRFGMDFNSTHTENGSGDGRSDDKGPEPEGLAVATLRGRTYVFVGLERMGGIMVYDVTNPEQPAFVQYLNDRDFTADPEDAGTGDYGPEGLRFVPAADSPTGVPLLLVGNEVSGTTSIYAIEVITPDA